MPAPNIAERTNSAVVPRTESHELLPAVLGAIDRRNILVQAMQKKVMVKGIDYGTVPGTEKPTLLKPGAEKLCTLFGLCTEEPEIKKAVEDWTGAEHGGEPFFCYLLCQRLTRNGETVAAQMGSCNSWEKKYRYRWVPLHEVPPELNPDKLKKQGGKISEFTFAVTRAETSGKYGKPAEYWHAFRDAIAKGTAQKIWKEKRNGEKSEGYEIDMTLFRIPNLDVADQVNSILKMAQKRALVAATVVATNASEFFTQDVEDLEVIETDYTVHEPTVKAQAPAPEPRAANAERLDLVNEKQMAELQALMQRAGGVSWARIAHAERLPSNYQPSDLTVQQFDTIAAKLQAMIAKNKAN